MDKLFYLLASGVVSLGLTGLMAAPEPGRGDGPPPPPKKKDAAKKDAAKKGEPEPSGDLRRAYDLLWRIKAETAPAGRGEERLHDWTERATGLYRKGVKAHEAGDLRLAHEYGAASHDLARAVDHARNASRFDRPDPDLPAPPESPRPEADATKAKRELRRAYDRVREADVSSPEAKFYADAARDLYNAARRDAQGRRVERAGELARAAEALTHVPEHLTHIAGRDFQAPEPKADRPEPPKAKGKKEQEKEKRDRPEPPKGKPERPDDDDLPPPIPPRD